MQKAVSLINPGAQDRGTKGCVTGSIDRVPTSLINLKCIQCVGGCGRCMSAQVFYGQILIQRATHS